MLAVTFKDKANYDQIQEHDLISVIGLNEFAPGRILKMVSFITKMGLKKVSKCNIRIMNSR